MPDKKDLLNKRKQSLLFELESIKRLLNDESDMIPILDETVVDDGEGNYTAVEHIPDTNISIKSPTNSDDIRYEYQDKSVLPGQQSLFNNKAATKSQSQIPSKKTKPLGDNPFLPKHVKKRLESRQMLAMSENAIQQNAGYTERLVEQLVAKYLPKIEAELRKKLLETVNRQMAQKTGKQSPRTP